MKPIKKIRDNLQRFSQFKMGGNEGTLYIKISEAAF